MATSRSILFSANDEKTHPVPSKFSLFVRYSRAWMSTILILSDVMAILLAFFIAMNIRLGEIESLKQAFYINFLWVPIPLLVIIYINNDLYPGIGLSAVEEVRRLSLSSSLMFLILITLTFLFKSTEIYSRIVIILAWGFVLILVPVTRYLIRLLCIRLKKWGEPVGIVGFPDRRVAEIADFFTQFPQRGIHPKAIFVEDSGQFKATKDYAVVNTEDIYSRSKYYRLNTVLVVVPNWNWVGENLDRYRYSFRRVVLIHQQQENFSLSDLVAMDFNGVIGFQVHHNLLNPWSMTIKRLMDITISLLALFFLAPFLGVISLLIHYGSPGPVLYRQNRLGKNGKEFKFLKFRTMYTNGDEIFQAKLKEDKNFRDEWRKFQKVKYDPRITRIGAFLRKYSIDELPQLINILKGDMSVVGPRPIMINQREMYGPGINDYVQIRPGVTGLWQVSGRNHTTFARRAAFDMEYIQRWSLWLDMYIILRTFREVVSKDGAY